MELVAIVSQRVSFQLLIDKQQVLNSLVKWRKVLAKWVVCFVNALWEQVDRHEWPREMVWLTGLIYLLCKLQNHPSSS